MGATCSRLDGVTVQDVTDAEQCWGAGGEKWTPFMSTSVINPRYFGPVQTHKGQAVSIPAGVKVAEVKVAEVKVAEAKAQDAAVVASNAITASAKADSAAASAADTAKVAAAAATDAKVVRDKCIAAANDAHKKAMDACGPEGVKKEGFGGMDAGACGMWLLFVMIMLVFIAICMQGGSDEKSVAREGAPFSINSALV